MNIKCVKEFDLEMENVQHFGMIPVDVNGKRQYLCVCSRDGIDPGEEFFHFASDTLKLMLFGEDGRLIMKRIWERA